MGGYATFYSFNNLLISVYLRKFYIFFFMKIDLMNICVI